MLSEIAKHLGCPAPDKDLVIHKAAIDSRKCADGDLFVCIKGENVDGHDFAAAAARNGAAAILANRPINVDAPVLVVEDTIKALGAIASLWRQLCQTPIVICITGTAGKTTLKDSLYSILQLEGKTLATEKNHNNQIGLPYTILTADGDEKYWILEAGINHEGDMEELGAIAQPNLAIILNVGPGHTEGLGKKGVAWHKTRLLNYLHRIGVALVSADYPDLVAETKKIDVDTLYFSTANRTNIRFRAQEATSGAGRYKLTLDDQNFEVQTPFAGGYGAEISVAAASAVYLMGIDISKIIEGFRLLKLPEQRFNRHKKGKWIIFDDTYNANPLSMRRMLESASNFAKNEGLPLIAVLGEMGELGAEARRCHADLAKYLAEIKPSAIFWKGNFYEDMGGHLPESQIFTAISSPQQFLDEWQKTDLADNGGVIIFKGSRANKLELFLNAFKNSIPEAGEN